MNGARALALGGAVVAGLLGLAIVQSPKENTSPSSDGTGGVAIVPGVPGTATPGLPVGAVPVPGGTREEVSEVRPSSDPEPPPDLTETNGAEVVEPPTERTERQAWHLAHAIPAWTDLERGLQVSKRTQFQRPVADLLLELEGARGGVSDMEYKELLEQERQLLGALSHAHPRLFPILEPMERLEDVLEKLDPRP